MLSLPAKVTDSLRKTADSRHLREECGEIRSLYWSAYASHTENTCQTGGRKLLHLENETRNF